MLLLSKQTRRCSRAIGPVISLLPLKMSFFWFFVLFLLVRWLLPVISIIIVSAIAGCIVCCWLCLVCNANRGYDISIHSTVPLSYLSCPLSPFPPFLLPVAASFIPNSQHPSPSPLTYLSLPQVINTRLNIHLVMRAFFFWSRGHESVKRCYFVPTYEI